MKIMSLPRLQMIKPKFNIFKHQLVYEFLAEFLGTFVLVLIGLSSIAQATFSNDDLIAKNKILFIIFSIIFSIKLHLKNAI